MNKPALFTLAVTSLASIALIGTAQAEHPKLKTPAPVIYLADNLDEKDQLGWCIDTVGRGFGENLHAHSCKPRGGDVQFSYNSQSLQIASATYENKCATLKSDAQAGTELGLVDCDADDKKQQFTYDADAQTFQPKGSADLCLAVGDGSRSAGPFMSRKLALAACAETDASLKQWIIKMPDMSPKVVNANPGLAAIAQFAALFKSAKVVGEPKIVNCKLSGGTKTSCFSITVKPEPSSYKPGPWCPRNVKDGADLSGIWLEGGKVYDADGSFMANLAEFYKDDEWQMVDPETGAIKVTDSLEKCQAAARPDVGPEYKNYCVECLPEYLPDTTVTYTIPMQQFDVAEMRPLRGSGAGVAFNGVRLDGPAPVSAILGAYTIAPFDDCGGHVNPNVGYHYHAATDCLNDTAAESSHAKKVGLAMDGHFIFSRQLADNTVPTDLDQCNGHTTDDEGYHYHAGEPGANQILRCLKAEYGCVSNNPDQDCDASKRKRRGPPPGGKDKRPPKPEKS